MFAFKKKKEVRDIIATNEPYDYDDHFPLLSIHLASNRPTQFSEFVENIHATCINKNAYEIIVKIDTEDERMISCLTELVKHYGENKIKPLIGPKKLGPWSTWEFYNEMFHMTHPRCYFLWNPSDEVRIVTPKWDKILETYIGFYQDNIFRLKLSDNRLRNFYKFHEVLGSPDNFPFMTKKWMDLCGLWGDCHSPDLFHQAVSYYLGLSNTFRDIPIFDIELAGIEAGLLIPTEQSASRTANIRRLWNIALSKQMRSRYIAHANKIDFFIKSCEKGAKVVTIIEHIDFPSKIICTNDIGMKKSMTCVDRSFIFYRIKLITLALLSKAKSRLLTITNMITNMLFSIPKRIIKKTLKYAFLNPVLFIILLASAGMLLKYSRSHIISIVSITLLCFGSWQLRANREKAIEILRKKIKL